MKRLLLITLALLTACLSAQTTELGDITAKAVDQWFILRESGFMDSNVERFIQKGIRDYPKPYVGGGFESKMNGIFDSTHHGRIYLYNA